MPRVHALLCCSTALAPLLHERHDVFLESYHERDNFLDRLVCGMTAIQHGFFELVASIQHLGLDLFGSTHLIEKIMPRPHATCL
jgi:hypothetical protein